MEAGTIEERYIKVTKKFLLISGIWPNQNKYVQDVCRFIIYTLALLIIMAQVMRVVRYFSFLVLVEQLPFIFSMILILAKYITYVVKDAEFRTLMTGMFNDWKIDRSKEELAIMTSYLDKGVIITAIYTANVYGITVLYIQTPWWPRIADIVMPLNTSRPRKFIVPVSLPFDGDKYYYWIILVESIVTLIMMTVHIACDTFFMYIVQHACGLFATCGYRFKEAIRDVPTGYNISKLSDETYRKVCRSIEAHNRAITFLKEIEEIHFGYFWICLGIATGMFTGTLALLSTLDLCDKFYQSAGFLIIQVVHLLSLTIQGQFVIDSKWKVYNEIYAGLWYNAAPKAQMPFMLALRATLTAPEIRAGGHIPMNLETFATIIKASFSYFTVLKST